ncbi:hypothetical protein ANN_17447 [Periplaneta americana]|uniref:Uncharacterized protein n=1 Tax=Periplaneta americana TaxID=6978 RepID=A0ABQ8ST16_PERAM|nr:hypothetical protein ANN_17447 [Periplaneta americana]
MRQHRRTSHARCNFPLIIEMLPPYLEAVSSIRILRTRHVLVKGTHNTWILLQLPYIQFVKESANLLLVSIFTSVKLIRNNDGTKSYVIQRRWTVDGEPMLSPYFSPLSRQFCIPGLVYGNRENSPSPHTVPDPISLHKV